MSLEAIAERLHKVRHRIATAALLAGRDPGSIELIAVSKTFPAAYIRAAFAAGQRHFGENYAQEAAAKIASLNDLNGIVWHFIGPIQGNKTRIISEYFHWVHSVDRPKVAERLSLQRPPGTPALKVCLQVNVSGESTKSGALPEETGALMKTVESFRNLELLGLMTIPEMTQSATSQREQFKALRALRDELRRADLPLSTLSMGMSNDLESAVMEGATMLRVGRAIFGERLQANGR